MIRFSVFFSCMFFVGISAVYAQSSARKEAGEKRLSRSDLLRLERSLEQFTGYYDEALRAIRSGSQKFDYDVSRLRQYYPKTDHYSPFAQSAIDDMTEYAYIADTSEDKEEANNALISYRSLLGLHLANLDVLTFALRMSRVDERLGDEVFLKRVRNALLKFVLYDGAECDKPEVACSIASYGEENYILGRIGGVVKHSEIYNVSSRYYNVHDLIKDGREIRVYIDVTEPIVNVNKLQSVLKQGGGVTVLPQ